MAKKNVLTQGKKLKADQAARAGDLEEAHALLKGVCRLDPTDTEAWVKLALIEKRLGHFAEAETCARRAVALNPRLGFCHHALGVALHSQQRLPEAIASYRKAVELQPGFADSHFLLGGALHESGALSDAILSYQIALSLQPNFPEVLGNLGAILIDTGDVERGRDLLEKCLALQPNNVVARSNLSIALRLQGKVDEALQNFCHALLLYPDSLDAISGLAGLLEKTGRLVEAKSLIERGLEMAPTHPGINLVAALLARREKRLHDAAGILEKLRTGVLSLEMAGEIELSLGQIYDDLGDSERAWPLFVSGKHKKAAVSLWDDAGRRKYLERVSSISRLASPALTKCTVVPAKDVHDGHEPVFLIGFPRSGTTLLEQILDSHPAIQTMEETGAVASMVIDFLADAGDDENSLLRLNDEGIGRLRELYFAQVKRHIDLRPGFLFVDKMPLNTVGVPLLWRVFPRAKYILAVRHPCDVTLSCLMQNFAVNEGMASFFSLEDTAKTYAAVMGAWQKYVDLLPLDYHRIRYEDLVADVEGESRKLLEFLSVPWEDSVLDYAEHARRRGAINTPSYHQVVQPIYQSAKYRWKRYEREFAPVMPLLQPFIRYFGYDEPGL